MSDTPNKTTQASSDRVTGGTLRFAASLMESSLFGPMLYKAAVKRLGLVELYDINLPPHAGPHQHLHLFNRPATDEKDLEAGDE